MKKILLYITLIFSFLLIAQVSFADECKDIYSGHISTSECECPEGYVFCKDLNTGQFFCRWEDCNGTGWEAVAGGTEDEDEEGEAGGGAPVSELDWGAGDPYEVDLGEGGVGIYTGDFNGLATAILEFIRNIVLAIVPLVVVWAGILFATANGDPKKVELAKKIIMWASIGLIIILIAQGILETIKGFIPE